MATMQDDDMYLFQSDSGQTSATFGGQTFDSMFESAEDDQMATPDFLDSTITSLKQDSVSTPKFEPSYTRASTSSASSSGSSKSRNQHYRNISAATTASPATIKNEPWTGNMQGLTMPSNHQYYNNNNMSVSAAIDEDSIMDQAFNFDTAASTPSGFDDASMNAPPNTRLFNSSQQFQTTPTMVQATALRKTSPRTATAPGSFFMSSREASPLNTMLSAKIQPTWPRSSPASGLEETFHHMGMNGDSPGNATFPSNLGLGFTPSTLNFDQESADTPSSFTKEIASPPSTVHSVDIRPIMKIYPTSLKSRVETQIPIRMTLYPLPPGIRKLRLPQHTVSKPKFLAKPEPERAADTLELYVSLVCTSAMQNAVWKERALARARGEDSSAYARPSPASSTSASSFDEDKPLQGGEVHICTGCIQRERKRASRKKQKKPEEEELFQKDEEKRVVVFNTNEVKEWVEVVRDPAAPSDEAPLPAGTMQVELPMRIACYCRHQNEKQGFQVVLTVKDWRDRVIAQAMTNSIMITDDHKTHNTPGSLASSSATNLAALTGGGTSLFANGIDASQLDNLPPKLFKQSFSTPDLTRLQNSFAGQFSNQTQAQFNMPLASGTTTATVTPRNLSRPASPSGPSGPSMKRRKPSGSGKLPSGLVMTRLDNLPTHPAGHSTVPNSPFVQSMPGYLTDQPYPPASRPNMFTHSPTVPQNQFSNMNRSFSLENLPRQAMVSAPGSRHPSRPTSPVAHSSRNPFQTSDPNLLQAVNNQLAAQAPRVGGPSVHKIVPAHGGIEGGTEVTLLGNNFTQGLEVMFGDAEALTTTYWSEKSLLCIVPASAAPGVVPVVFKHEHPRFAGQALNSSVNSNPTLSQMHVHPVPHNPLQSPTHPQQRQILYTYTNDDQEIEMLRLALRRIGQQSGNDDPIITAQQILQQAHPQMHHNMFSAPSVGPAPIPYTMMGAQTRPFLPSAYGHDTGQGGSGG